MTSMAMYGEIKTLNGEKVAGMTHDHNTILSVSYILKYAELFKIVKRTCFGCCQKLEGLCVYAFPSIKPSREIVTV